jgi:hypothetical protein
MAELDIGLHGMYRDSRCQCFVGGCLFIASFAGSPRSTQITIPTRWRLMRPASGQVPLHSPHPRRGTTQLKGLDKAVLGFFTCHDTPFG